MPRPSVAFAWKRLPPPHYIGGAERSAQLLGTALSECGYEVIHVGTQELPWKTVSARDYELFPYSYMWHGQEVFDVASELVIPTIARLIHDRDIGCIITSHEGSDEIVRLARAGGVKTIDVSRRINSSMR